MNRRFGRLVALLLLDTAIVSGGYLLAYWLRLDVISTAEGIERYFPTIWATLPFLIAIRIACGMLVKQYSWSFHQASLPEAFGIANGVVAGTFFFIILSRYLPGHHPPPKSVFFIEFTTTLIGMGFIRFFPRYVYIMLTKHMRRFSSKDDGRLRTIIYGAGHMGEMLLRDIQRLGVHPYNVIGMVDDDPMKIGTRLHGVQVLGGGRSLPEVIEHHRIEKILVAVPNISAGKMREIVDLCGGHHIKFKIVPSFEDVIKRGSAPVALKDINAEDLLQREEVEFDSARMAEFFIDKTVLVTGAAGSIGSEICRQVAQHGVRRLVALDINENDLYFLRLDIQDIAPGINFEIAFGSIREAERMDAIFKEYKPDIVFHAAAHKHVPLMEACPLEALKNNVIGTINVGESAIKYGAERFVLISSDKAVKPSNIMGATKQLAEFAIDELDRRGRTKFMAVRFGNVLGSNGSLIPILKRQIDKGGPVTITHPNMTRYFMTIPEAVGLVLIASVQHEGRVCVLDMGEPISIDKLIRQMIIIHGLIPETDIEIKYIGLRPGEKMYEELFSPEEKLTRSSHPRIRVAEPQRHEHDPETARKALADIIAKSDENAAREYICNYVKGFCTEGC
ncbi:MAG: polysaccharide biosynthesis protein [Planctomycetes bacterium]|nr:polysaccharide biosynthesis protein [Planctomycetota bacterium]